MDCAHVDELSAAYSVGALDTDEERAVSRHLAMCVASHDALRAHVDASGIDVPILPPQRPPSAILARLMATIARTPNDHGEPAAVIRAPIAAVDSKVAEEARLPWWRAWPSPLALAAVALVAVIGLGAWNLSLNNRLTARDDALRAIAAATAIHPATGPAGSGWVVDSGSESLFVGGNLAAIPAGSVYEMWLIGADGEPVPVGTLARGGEFAVIRLEQPIGTATTFEVTMESERVESPTSDPVLVAPLEG